MAAPTLTLQLSDKTLKKLRALAMLSGSTVDQLEQEFAAYFDQMLTENIAHLLSEMDGKPVQAPVDEAYNWEVKEPAATKEKVETKVQEEREEDPNAHNLSEDDLPEEVKSTAEQVEDEIQPPDFQAPQAGNNAEAFLDAAMSVEKAVPQQEITVGGITGRLRAAGKGFNPSKPRATVAEFTGDN